MKARRGQQGLTLIEIVIAVVVVGIAASVILATLGLNVNASADPMVRQQAVAIAGAYLEEILLRDFDDPDGADGEAARTDFDDVDDYHALVDVGARDQFDNPIAGLDTYTVAVTAVASGALPGVAAADALRVDVTVSRAPALSVTLSGYRTR